MGYIDKRLLKAAANAGRKLPIGIGDSIKATYTGYDTKMDEKYNKMRFVFSFKLQDGSTKEIATSAGKVLRKMANIMPGSTLVITKLGEQQQTDYEFEIVSTPKAPISTVEEEEVVEPEEEEDEEEEDEEEAPKIKAKF